MAMIKFCDLTSSSDQHSWSDFFKKLIADQNLPIEYESLDVSTLGEGEALLLNLKRYDVIRSSFDSSNLLLNLFVQMPSDVQAVSGFDLLIKKNEVLWPQLHFTKVLRELIVKKSPEHKTTEAAYVVSDSSIGRALVALFVQMGHKKIVWVTDQQDEAKVNIEYIQRVYFGAKIELLSKELLTQQNDRASILVSTLSEEKDREAISDLVYFNFMSKDSLVVDLNPEIVAQSTLVAESGNAFLNSISSLEFKSNFDVSLLKLIVPDCRISEDEYMDIFLKTRP